MINWNDKFRVLNICGGVLISGVIALRDGDDIVIDPNRASEKTVEDFKIFYRSGKARITNDIGEIKDQEVKDELGVKKIQTVKNADGDLRDHYVADSNQKIIGVNQIELGKGIINVTEDLTAENYGAIEVKNENQILAKDEGRMTREDAINFLERHWKTVASDVAKITDKRKLNYILVVAIEVKAADKKRELIEARLIELES